MADSNFKIKNGLEFVNASYNIPIGYQALSANVSGTYNISVGHYALTSNTYGSYNIVSGYYAMQYNTDGSYNIAFGNYALNTCTTGMYNIAIGAYAMWGDGPSTGAYNIGIGYGAVQQVKGTSRNIGIGYSALEQTTTGYGNIGLGFNAGKLNTTGGSNIAIGNNSLYSNTTGAFNIAIGSQQTLYANTTGGENIALGIGALRSNTTGTGNIAMGNSALYASSTGNSSIAFGDRALTNLTGDGGSVAIGHRALQNATTGYSNVSIGYYSFVGATSGMTGTYNVGIGSFNLNKNTSGAHNVAIGKWTLKENTTGTHNISLGLVSLTANTTGSHNIGIGYGALYANTTGGNNTSIGYYAGKNNVTGSKNVFIGWKAGFNETGSNKLYISNSDTSTPLIHGDFSTGVLTVNGSLNVTGSSPTTGRNVIINGAMQVHQRGTSTAGITAGGYYTADRWKFDDQTLGTWTQTIENDGPTGSGFRKSLKVLCTTADATPVSTDFLLLRQHVEGQNVQAFFKGTASATQITVSFWVKSNVTGTYVVALEDTDNNRYVASSYTIAASGTWERKTITFAADTTGQFDNDANSSFSLNMWLAGGSNYTSSSIQATWGTPNWSNGTTAGGQVNLASATNNYWQVTGIQVEPGPVATPFEFESYGITLRKCLRYFWRHAPSGIAYLNFVYGGSQSRLTIPFPEIMRVAPHTITATGWAGGTTPSSSTANVDAINFYAPSGNFYTDTGTVITVSAEL